MVEGACLPAWPWPHIHLAPELWLGLCFQTAEQDSRAFIAGSHSLRDWTKVLFGYAVFRCIERDSGLFELEWIWVEPRCRTKGVARSLIAAIFNRLGSRVLWLEVSANNQAAVRAYSKMGFVQQGVRKNYYRDGSSAILMELKPASGTFRQGLVSSRVS